MKKINKKGFTLIELVIVIAVVAILCAVLIPTFISLAKKAKVSNDTVLVKNLNTILAMSEATDGKNVLMGDALQDVFDNGFVVTNLTPTSEGYDIVWDRVNDRFRLYNGSTLVYSDEGQTKATTQVDLWKVYSEVPATQNQTYSIYLRDGASVTTADVKVGFDVGNNTSVTNINYTSSSEQSVIIHSNGGTINVNAPQDTVKHFGTADFLNITAINTTACWEEYGFVPQAQIKSGKIVNTAGTIEVNNVVEKVGVQSLFIEAKDESTFDEVILEVKENAEFPTLDRADIDIADSGTLVVKTETANETKFIYLYKAGIEEQIVIKSTKSEITSSDVQGLAGATTQEVKDAAKELANIVKRNDQGQPIDSSNNVIDLTAADAETKLVKTEEKASADDISKGTTLFSGGTGTKSNPYLISSEEELTAIEELYGATDNNTYGVSKNADKHFYFKQINDIVLTKNGPAFAGSYDGGNYSLHSTINTGKYYKLFSGTSGDIEIKNLNVYEPQNGLIVLVWMVWNNESVTFENINFYNEIGTSLCNHSNTNSGLLCINSLSGNTRATSETRVVTIRNVVNRANIYSSGTCGAIFFAKTINSDDNACLTKLRMYNCTNYGNFTAPNWAGVIDGNSGYGSSFSSYPAEYQEYFASDETLKELVYLENVKNYGLISSKENSDYKMDCFVTCGNTANHLFARLNTIYRDTVGGTYVKIADLSGIGKVYYDGGNVTLESTNANVATYKVLLHVGQINSVSGYFSNSASIVLDATVGTGTTEIQTLNTYVYDVNTANGKGINTATLNYNISIGYYGVNAALYQQGNNLYLIIQNGNTVAPTESTISGIKVVGYDANGNSLGTYSIE